MSYVKTALLATIALMFLACARKGPDASPPTGFAALEAARAAGLNFECTGTQCECDATAPIESTRTCSDMVNHCRTKGADTINCKLSGPMTCTCKFALIP